MLFALSGKRAVYDSFIVYHILLYSLWLHLLCTGWCTEPFRAQFYGASLQSKSVHTVPELGKPLNSPFDRVIT